MRVLTFLNEKGGVGKTTLSTHVAAGLALRGFRTLLIDADPQGHATISLGVKKQGGLYGLIVQERPWDDIIIPPLPRYWAGAYESPNPADEPMLYLVAGNIETQAIPVVTDPSLTLKDRLSELEGWLDFVVIDTPPTPSALQMMVYLATTHLIYPTQTQQLSLDGLAESVGRLQRLARTRAELGDVPVTLLGVAPNQYRAQTTAHQYGMGLLKTNFGMDGVLPAISDATVWRDREFANQTIFAYAQGSRAEDEMWTLIDALSIKVGVSTHG